METNVAKRERPLTSPVRKVYFYHLKKCGGTSLNNWLDLQVDENRIWKSTYERAISGWMWGEDVSPDRESFLAKVRSIGIGAFYLSDVIHSHTPMRRFVPSGVFSFTVLREPISRILSQIADWRRLGSHDWINESPQVQECIADTHVLRVKPYLEKHGQGVGRWLLDNHMVRALAASRLGPLLIKYPEAEDLLPTALESLSLDFDLVGLAERDQETRNSISESMGWCPALEIPRLNQSGSVISLQEEAEEAAPLLAKLTRLDTKLYDRATRIFATQIGSSARFDCAIFDQTAASAAVQRLGAISAGDGRVIFSVRQSLIGFGFHGRDAADTPNCAVWTGPHAVARLYMPVPPCTDLAIFLLIRGYAHEQQREILRVRIDGKDAPYRLEHEDGYRDRLVVEVFTMRSFISLEIEVAPQASGTFGEPGSDHRPRGICFDRYGWATR